MLLVLVPVALISTAVIEGQTTVALPLAALEPSIVNVSVRVHHHALPVLPALIPITFVVAAIDEE